MLWKRWIWATLTLALLGWTGWHFGVELPERRAFAELKRKQAENARHIPDLSLDLVWIPPGEFLMGTPGQSTPARWYYAIREMLTERINPGNGSRNNERPVTWVTLTQKFWLGRTEVTQAQWMTVMGSNPSNFKGDDLPVENISWDQATEFCRKLTDREHTAGRLPADYIYTLPTEAQWEYACRAGSTGDITRDITTEAWSLDNGGLTTHPVGTKVPNAWGLYDMQGNVAECCLDWFGVYPGGKVTNPTGPASGSIRVVRGGAWGFSAESFRYADREFLTPSLGDIYLGLRIALVPLR